MPEPAAERGTKFAGRNVFLGGGGGGTSPSDPSADSSAGDDESGRGMVGGRWSAVSPLRAVTPTSLRTSSGMSETRMWRAMQTSYMVQLSTRSATRKTLAGGGTRGRNKTYRA